MIIELSGMVKKNQQHLALIISERLPQYVMAPCVLAVNFQVELNDDFYLIHLKVTGDLRIVCQRCIGDYPLAYDNTTTLAVCKNDERATTLLEHYETVVSEDGRLDLEAIVVDELHLYAPQFHAEFKDCDELIMHI